MKPEVIPWNELSAGAESRRSAPTGRAELVWDL